MSTGTQLRLIGLKRTESKHKIAVQSARIVAAMIAAEEGVVDIERVYERGIAPVALGNASGCVFHSPEFEFVRYRKATRASRHCAPIGVWKLR